MRLVQIACHHEFGLSACGDEERLMKRNRWLKTIPFWGCFSLFSLLFGGFPRGASQIQPGGQSGSVQRPVRLCVMTDFGNGKTDSNAANADHPLVQGPEGDDNFYGATPSGGTNNQGTVFMVTPGGDKTVLYSFTGKADGGQPRGGVTLGSDGNLYGTTYGGGKYAAGTIFKMGRSIGTPQTLYSFHSGRIDPPLPYPQQPTKQQTMDAAPAYPQSAPVDGGDGYLYGVTDSAAGASGSLYVISKGGGYFRCLHLFTNKDAATYGTQPMTLTLGKDGSFYGTTDSGGLKWGTVFRFNPQNQSSATAGITTIYRFDNTPPKSDGTESNGVIQGANRNLYGTMYSGGPGGRGLVFSLTLLGQFTVLHYFGGNASNPNASLVEVPERGLVGNDSQPVKSGNAYYLYGACTMCGSVVTREDTGVLFRLAEDGSDYSVVYNFDGTTGVDPAATPILGRNSSLYGLTGGGGKFGEGVLYCLDTVYLATGAVAADKPACKDPFRQRLEFQGNGQSWIYTNAQVQVATHMAGLQPAQGVASMQSTSDGITIRAKTPGTRFVQFFYREQELKGELQAGLGNEVDLPSPNIYNQNDRPYAWAAATTYNNKEIVTVGDQYWISTKGSNKGNTPAAGSTYWAAMDSRGCTTAVHSCYPLTTDSTHPNWIPDAEPVSPIYTALDTQAECDGLTLFDSPSFNGSPNGETWWFTGLDYMIVGGKVIGTVEWQVQKPPNKPQVYTFVDFGGPPAPQTLAAVRAVLKKYGFSQPF